MFLLSLPLIKSGCSEKHLPETFSSLYSSILTRLKTEEMRWRGVCGGGVCWVRGWGVCTSLLSVSCSSWISKLKQWLYLFKGRSFSSHRSAALHNVLRWWRYAECFCLCRPWPALLCNTNTHACTRRLEHAFYAGRKRPAIQKETRAWQCTRVSTHCRITAVCWEPVSLAGAKKQTDRWICPL